MVNIIENWANIKGTIVAISNNPGLPEFYLVEVKLESASDVEGFPNLAKADKGKIIQINVRKTEMEKNNIILNAPISCAVRKSFGQIYFIQ